MKNVNKINPDGLIKVFSECDSGQFGVMDSNNFFIGHSSIQPIEGFIEPVNSETGEQFPKCCRWHEATFDKTLEWFDKFPDCCQGHKKLNGESWFNKNEYNDIASKVVTQLVYTEHCVSENINKTDWLGAITEYIEWNIESFGQLPNGYGNPIGLELYINSLKLYLDHLKVKNIKKVEIVNYIDNQINTKIEDRSNTDLNVLNETYKKWLKVFPFEISYFAHLKQHFQNQIPMLKDKPIINRYSGRSKAKIHTKSSLIDFLVRLTNDLLTQFNSFSLYEKGLLTEPKRKKLELVLNERKMKLKQGYVNNSKNEDQRYRNILKEWFADEKAFINEIAPLLKSVPPSSDNILEKDGYQSKEWCAICYFSDYLDKDESKTDTSIIKAFHHKHDLPFAVTTFIANFRIVKRHIINSEKQAVRLIKNILPHFSEDEKMRETIENELSIINDDLERR